MRKLLCVLALAAGSAQAASYSFLMTEQCKPCTGDQSGWMELATKVTGQGLETFSTTDGSLVEINFLGDFDSLIPDVYGQLPPASVTFNNGKLSSVTYFKAITGDEWGPIEYFQVSGLLATHAGYSWSNDWLLHDATLVSPVPEPASWLLALVGLPLVRRFRATTSRT